MALSLIAGRDNLQNDEEEIEEDDEKEDDEAVIKQVIQRDSLISLPDAITKIEVPKHCNRKRLHRVIVQSEFA